MDEQEKCQRCGQILTQMNDEIFPCESCDRKLEQYARQTGTDLPALKRILRSSDPKMAKLLCETVGIRQEK